MQNIVSKQVLCGRDIVLTVMRRTRECDNMYLNNSKCIIAFIQNFKDNYYVTRRRNVKSRKTPFVLEQKSDGFKEAKMNDEEISKEQLKRDLDVINDIICIEHLICNGILHGLASQFGQKSNAITAKVGMLAPEMMLLPFNKVSNTGL